MPNPAEFRSCQACGRQPPPEDVSGPTGVPWTWSTGEDGVLCDTCARDHARSIEAKLDRDWW